MVSRITIRRDDGPYGKLVFDPPSGSQDLKEALRLQYPKLSDHRSRVEKASLEFFLNEMREPTRTCGQAAVGSNPSAVLVDPSLSSRNSATAPAVDGTLYDSTIGISPADPPLSKSSGHRLPSKASPGVPQSHQITFDPQMQVMKPPKRRHFTSEEKANIRDVRKAGACASCRKRKRKVKCLYSKT